MDRAEYLLFELMRTLPCRVFLDIGSRDGHSALKASRVLPDARFICFEASRENFERILSNPRIGRERFQVEHLALSDENGPLDFRIYENPDAPENRGLSSLRIRKELEPTRIEEVRGMTLDRYLADRQLEADDLVLWIDVEGAALDVLRGAVDALAETNLVYVEVELDEIYEETDTRSDVRGFLAERGFREILFRPHGSGRVGDAIFVSERVHHAHRIGVRLRWWKAKFLVVAPYHAVKRFLFEAFSRVPLILKIWRRFKPPSR